MDYTLWLGFIIAVVVFLSTPGPVTVMVANNGAKAGFLAGLLTILGTNLASLVLIGVSFLALFGVVALSDTLLNWLTFFGAVYLLYFAVGILKDAKTSQNLALSKDQNQTPFIKPKLSYVKQGFLVGISNPKDVLFFMAFFPLFFGVHSQKAWAVVILTLTWVILDYAILSLYGIIFAKIRHPKFVSVTSRLSGVILLVVGVLAIYKMAMLIKF